MLSLLRHQFEGVTQPATSPPPGPHLLPLSPPPGQGAYIKEIRRKIIITALLS